MDGWTSEWTILNSKDPVAKVGLKLQKDMIVSNKRHYF